MASGLIQRHVPTVKYSLVWKSLTRDTVPYIHTTGKIATEFYGSSCQNQRNNFQSCSQNFWKHINFMGIDFTRYERPYDRNCEATILVITEHHVI